MPPDPRVAAERSIEEFRDTAAFRAWLAEHHAASPGIWLKIGKKNSGLVTTTHDEALEAALAYGWIDGQARPGDETYWLQGFTRRTSRSPWSKRNCDNAERLIVAETIDNSELKAILEASSPTPKIVPGTGDAAKPRAVPEAVAAADAAEGAG